MRMAALDERTAFGVPKSSRTKFSKPYIGAGIGYASVSTPSCALGTDCFKGGSTGTFAYQGKLGITYRASKMSDVYVEGAYLGTTGFTINTVSYDNIGAYRVTVGWRQRF